jgi:penicillin-binding protein 2
MKTRLHPFQGWRLAFFQAVMFAVFALFGLRLYQFQVAEYDLWFGQAEENRLSELPLAAPRGVIFDRYGRRLAFNVPAYNVTIVPAELPDDENEELRIFNRLSALVNVPPTREIALASSRDIVSIEELVAGGEGVEPFRPVVIAQDVDRQVAMIIREERGNLPGVDIQIVEVREYPTGALTSQIVGYLGPIGPEEAEALIEQGYNPAFDRIGYAGVEGFLENILGGRRGGRLREVDVVGQEIQLIEERLPVPGGSVRLTIDIDLQQAAEQALRNEIALVNATAGRLVTQQGVVIAMNPKTGELLAMISWPTYDNTKFARAIDGEYYLQIFNDPLHPLVNSAIQGEFPPGSVWKVLTMAAAMEEKVIDPASELVDGGDLIVENRYAPNDPAASQRFVCWLDNGHGRVNAIEAIAWSCDVYFYQIGGGNPRVSPQTLRAGGLGDIDLFRYATAMGIGSQQGIELPAETAGRMPDREWKRRNYGENWSTGDTYNAAFGQGYVKVTPLQLINSIASIINGGTLYQATIIGDLLDAEGNVIQPFTPHVIRNVNIENLAPDEPITLLVVEDMMMKASNSLACYCDPNTEYYNPLRCSPETYRNTVDIDDSELRNIRQYKLEIPLNYSFAGDCQPLRWDPDYSPAFVSSSSLDIVTEGMRASVIIEGGTGLAAQTNIPDVEVAGKTGTAEYCDNIARPLGLCVPGNWPAHAWFTAYAPYDSPEILIIAFVYNGGEGSAVALPVVVETMQAYLRLKNERRGDTQLTVPPSNSPTS